MDFLLHLLGLIVALGWIVVFVRAPYATTIGTAAIVSGYIGSSSGFFGTIIGLLIGSFGSVLTIKTIKLAWLALKRIDAMIESANDATTLIISPLTRLGREWGKRWWTMAMGIAGCLLVLLISVTTGGLLLVVAHQKNNVPVGAIGMMLLFLCIPTLITLREISSSPIHVRRRSP